MKFIRQGIALFLIAGMAQAAEEFEVKAYSPLSGAVEISCGGEITNRPFSSFGAAEQQKITGWLADKEFQSSSGLVIETEKKEVRRKTNAGKNTDWAHIEGKTTDISYGITLENRSEVAFENVEIAYQIFYERWDEAKKVEKVQRSGTYRENLPPSSIRTFETQSASIRDEKIVYLTYSRLDDGTEYGAPTINVQDKLAGLYLCVSKKDDNGKTIDRECIVGEVPGKEARANYQQREKDEQTVIPNPPDGSGGNVMSERMFRQYTKAAEKGNYLCALDLGEHYCGRGDLQKARQWTDKARERIEKLPSEERGMLLRRLTNLDQKIKASAER